MFRLIKDSKYFHICIVIRQTILTYKRSVGTGAFVKLNVWMVDNPLRTVLSTAAIHIAYVRVEGIRSKLSITTCAGIRRNRWRLEKQLE